MTVHSTLTRTLPPGRGSWELVKVEGKRAQRAPVGLLLGVLVPVVLLIIFSAIPGLKQLAPGSTLTMFTQYVPVLIGMSVCLIALVSLPIPVVSDRQAGVLRRFATTPAPPSWVLAAQVIVNFALVLIAIVILVAGSVLFFGVHMPSQWGGFVLSALLCTAAMFGIGLLITSLARSPCRVTSRRPGPCWSWPPTRSSSASPRYGCSDGSKAARGPTVAATGQQRRGPCGSLRFLVGMAYWSLPAIPAGERNPSRCRPSRPTASDRWYRAVARRCRSG